MAMNRTIAAVATVCLAAATHAQQQQQPGDIAYRSGGVGDAEQRAMLEARDEYSLGLTFATREGPYIAGVDVVVKNATGDVVLSRQAQGPMVLADLPAGRYTVEATFNGRMQRQEVTVPATGHQHVTLNWSQ